MFGRRRIWIILFQVIREINTATILHNKTNKSKCKYVLLGSCRSHGMRVYENL